MGDKSKIIWITGASTGIGKSISFEFMKNGCTVAGSSRQESQLLRIQKEVENLDQKFEVFPLDITDSKQVAETCDEITNDNEISCLINNAGVTSFDLALNNTVENIDNIIKTNLLGAIYTIQAVLPIMMENKCGTIINILSVAATKVFTKSSVYSASKAGLLAYTNVLREEVRDYNIKIINVLPGATRTPIWPNHILETSSDKMMSPDDVAKVVYQLYESRTKLVAEEITIRPINGDL